MLTQEPIYKPSSIFCFKPILLSAHKLIGYDGTTLFYHATYAASYTTRSATWQATPQATPGAVSTRERLDRLNGGFQEQGRKSRSEISPACKAIMYAHYVILYYIIGPTCRVPNGHVRASLEI